MNNKLISSPRRMFLCSAVVLSSMGLFASPLADPLGGFAVQTITQSTNDVTGVVSDKMGPIAGVNVLVKGTTNGVITDMDGKFILTNVNKGDVLQFSFIGYTTKEVKISNLRNLNVSMSEDTEVLDEVVVVGYGSQKKVNLTGSVGQVDSKVLESRPITSTASALQGTIPNLQITNKSGEPGAAASLNVRGTTSINGGGPLVLVDGVEMSLDLVNPNDIANVTVLKDAAASAIYGVRAAYGVILVTTKGASKESKTRISYSGNFSFAKPSLLPEFVESTYEFAEFINAACFNGNINARFSQDYLDAVKAYEADPVNNPEYAVVGGSLEYYGHSNLKDAMVKKSMPSQRHNLNISGGNDKTRFYSSIGYFNQKGLYKVGQDSFKSLNTRFTLENQTTKWLKFGTKVLYNYSTHDKPYTYDDKDIWHRVVYSSPTNLIYPWEKDPRYPELDHFEGMSLDESSYALLKNAGRDIYDSHDLWITASTDLKILKGWNAHIDFNYNLNYKKSSEHSKSILGFDKSFNETYGRTADAYYKMYNKHKNYYSLNAYTDYENTFGKHYLKAMVGYNQEFTKYSTFTGQRWGMLTESMPSLSLASGNHLTTQNGYEWALRGAFFRLNYIYNDRYLFEVNGRYDGTSRFPSHHRFVFLPSFSGAWRISEEKFMESTRGWLDNLKIRATYGELGNQLLSADGWTGNTKYYPYVPFMSAGNAGKWIFGEEKATLINPVNLVSNSLSWEKVKTVNAGIDITLFDQRLDFSFDYYQRTTSDMLVKAAYPDVLGTTAPPENSAELKTKGWELSLKWRDRIGDNFSYDLGFVLSDSKAEITKYNNPTGDIDTWYVGKEVGTIWGYETEGIFQTPEEVAEHPSQAAIKSVVWGPGDIKYKNLNGDDVINDGLRTLDNHGDLKIIGNTTPRFQYGITGNLTYKDYYLTFFMQGVGKRDAWFGDQAFWPAYTEYFNVQKWHVTDSWRPDNRDAYFPIPRAKDHRNYEKQSRFIQDASYLRMKNITVGWNLPKKWISKVFLSNASIYVSGENLFEISHMKGAYDPEAAGGNGKMLYPFMRTYSFGVNLTF